jgi:hypothetical protein
VSSTLPADNGPEVFWGELAPCDHVVQIYDTDEEFLECLTTFVAEGLTAGEAAVVIATSPHLNALENRLYSSGVDLNAAIWQDRYIPLNAAETLMKFVVEGWPVDDKFHAVIDRILRRARAGGRRVRAFGEMVALMWEKGFHGATARLEHLWNRLCKAESFPLLCAYPRSGFTENTRDSLKSICAEHSRAIHSWRGGRAA